MEIEEDFKQANKDEKPWFNEEYEKRLRKCYETYRKYLFLKTPIRYDHFLNNILTPRTISFTRVNHNYINRAFQYEVSSVYEFEDIITTIKMFIVDLFMLHDLIYCSKFTKREKDYLINHPKYITNPYIQFRSTDLIKNIKNKRKELKEKGLEPILPYTNYPGKNDENYLKDNYFNNRNNELQKWDFGEYSEEVPYAFEDEIKNNDKYEKIKNKVNTTTNNNKKITIDINSNNRQNNFTRNNSRKLINNKKQDTDNSVDKKRENNKIGISDNNYSKYKNYKNKNINTYKFIESGSPIKYNFRKNNYNEIINQIEPKIKPQNFYNLNNKINNNPKNISQHNNKINISNNNQLSNKSIIENNISFSYLKTDENNNEKINTKIIKDKKSDNSNEVINEISMFNELGNNLNNDIKTINQANNSGTSNNNNKSRRNSNNNIIANNNTQESDESDIKTNNISFKIPKEHIYVMNVEGIDFNTNEYIQKCIIRANGRFKKYNQSSTEYYLTKLYMSDKSIKRGNMIFMIICILSGINPKYYMAIRKAVDDSLDKIIIFLPEYQKKSYEEKRQAILIDGSNIKFDLLIPFSEEYKISFIFEYLYHVDLVKNEIKLGNWLLYNQEDAPKIFVFLHRNKNGFIEAYYDYYIDTGYKYLIPEETRIKFRKYVEDYIKLNNSEK